MNMPVSCVILEIKITDMTSLTAVYSKVT